MAWYSLAPNPYLSQCWHRSMSSCHYQPKMISKSNCPLGYPTSVFVNLYRSRAITSTNDDSSLILIFVTKSEWVNICLCRIVVHMYIWICRDHFVYVPSQWETTLQCNIVSHWLGAYTKRSLNMLQNLTIVVFTYLLVFTEQIMFFKFIANILVLSVFRMLIWNGPLVVMRL